jgi:acetoin utilization deacetylase AcuC-like enzyme
MAPLKFSRIIKTYLPFLRMENNNFQKETSDLDIAFDDGTTDDEFLSTIASVIPQLIETQNQILYFTWLV